MNIWKTFAENEVTHSVAHYLTTLHDLHARLGYARVSDIARALDVTKGSVSLQMRHLKERGLVIEDENRFLKLSPVGEEIAHEVMQNRQVFVEFLVTLLGIPREQALVDACKIEHLLSRDASHKLLGLVHLLQSDDEAARRFRERFREYQPSCAGSAGCRLCSYEGLTMNSAAPPASGPDENRPADSNG